MRPNASLGSSLSILLLSAFALSAQQPAPRDDTVYQAIRANDLAALRTAIAQHGINTPDADGMTPLVLAAAIGSADAVTLLLKAGADVNVAASGGVTPLHVAWHDVTIARALIDRGAPINARTSANATPLWVAASATGTIEVVKRLLARGADVDAADTRGVTPLNAAASVGNSAVAMLLLARGAAPDAFASGIGHKNATPLMGAAMNGDLPLARALLRTRPDVNRQSPDNDGIVKNGPVALGRMTALHLGVASRNTDMVRLLLESGASVDAPDIRGFTPLVWAIGSDRSNPAIARLLLEAGAERLAAAKDGETPVDWARRYNNPPVLSLLSVTPGAALPTAAASRAPGDARAAAERALPLMERAAGRVMADGGCVACHAQPLTVAAATLAASRGWGTGPDQTSLTQMRQQLNSGLAGFLAGRESGGLPDSVEFSLLAMSIAHVAPSLSTDAFAYYLAAKQRDAGNWHALTGRAPMQDGDITRTALAIRALSVYGSPARRRDFAVRTARAVRWLDAQQARTTEERVMQLLGLSWGHVDARRLNVRQRELVSLQRPDGGWAQTPDLKSDAYATGEALYTLTSLGVPASDAAVRRGVDFLLRSQAADGSWHVASRAMKIQPYFESGFPYGHDQWISHAGSAWAIIGLAAASPPPRPGGENGGPAATASANTTVPFK
jgi:ankyrin repeat protein